MIFGIAPGELLQSLDHAVLAAAPLRAVLRQPPQIDHVADEVQRVAIEPFQEIGELRRVAVIGAEVHVGDEHRAFARVFRQRAHAIASCAAMRARLRSM
ncbi:MAG: hypothetical protein QM771_02360 [Nitrospira sp.]